MKNTLLVTCMLFFALSTAFAQKNVTTEKERADTLSLSVSGDANVSYVSRPGIINETSFWIPRGTPAVYYRNAVIAPAFGDEFDDGEQFLSGGLTLRLSAEVAGKVFALVELENKPIAPVYSTIGGLTAPNPVLSNRNLGEDSLALYIEQAYVKIEQFLDPQLSIKLGAQDVKWDIRGRGNALFLDTTNSESPWSAHELFRVWPITERSTTEPAGVLVSYARENFDLNVGLFPSVLRPTALTGAGDATSDVTYARVDASDLTGFTTRNSVTNDETLYFVNGSVKIDQGKVGAIVALMSGPRGGDEVTTFGVGTSLTNIGVANLEVFGEGYTQTGKIIDENAILINWNPTGLDTKWDIDADGALATLGARYVFQGTQGNPWVEVSWLWVDGGAHQDPWNGDLINANVPAQAIPGETKEFLSYEGNNDFIILEGNAFGLDIDNNYTAIKVKSGMTLNTGAAAKDNLALEAKLGFFNTVRDLDVRTPSTGVLRSEDGLGVEVDANVNYILSKQSSLFLNAGWLFSSDVIKLFNRDEDDSGFMVTAGTSVNF